MSLWLIAPCVCAQEPTVINGVWRGEIGEAAVTVCFNPSDNQVKDGVYYYQKYLQPIFLTSESESGSNWLEGHYLHQWRIESVGAEQITGTWINNPNGKTLPLKLQRVRLVAEDAVAAVCGADFFRPLEKTPKIQHGKVVSLGGIKYQEKFVELSAYGNDGEDGYLKSTTIEIVGNTKAIKNLNRQLLNFLDVASLYACRRTRVEIDGRDGTLQRSVSDIAVNGNFLSLSWSSSDDCARNGLLVDFAEYTWDLLTGERENIKKWFNVDLSVKAFAELEKLDPIQWRECYGYTQATIDYQLQINGTGVVISIPPARSGACGESMTIPYAELAPHLNAYGKARVARILGK
jgi:hypothetical protein